MATAPQKKTESDAAVYVVQDALRHDGKAYAIGDLVELTAAQAAALPAGIVAPSKAGE